MRLVKFLAENNLKFQTLSERDERKLLASAAPMGHSTVTVTMRYAHSNDEAKRRALSRLPK